MDTEPATPTLGYRNNDGDTVIIGGGEGQTLTGVCNGTGTLLYMGAATLAVAGSLSLAAALAI